MRGQSAYGQTAPPSPLQDPQILDMIILVHPSLQPSQPHRPQRPRLPSKDRIMARMDTGETATKPHNFPRSGSFAEATSERLRLGRYGVRMLVALVFLRLGFDDADQGRGLSCGAESPDSRIRTKDVRC